MTPDESSTDLPVSRILKRVSEGEVRAAEELLPLVYDELRQLAAARIRNEASELRLQPTAVVHEAYPRLLSSEPQSWENRRHFFSAAAEAMRRILIEHARSRDRIKRGGELLREPLADIAISPSVDLSEIIAVHEVLEEFEREMPDKAELVKLRYFAGLDEVTAADTGDLSPDGFAVVDFLACMAIPEAIGTKSGRIESMKKPVSINRVGLS